MAMSDILTTLTARRDRFRELLAVKSVEVASDASLLQCLDALANLFGVMPGIPDDFYGERKKTNFITVEIPAFDPPIIDPITQESSTMESRGLIIQLDELMSYNQSFDYLDKGTRIRIDVGEYVGRILLYWYPSWKGGSLSDQIKDVSPDEVYFDGYHSPQYYKRPSHDGVLKLIVDGQEAPLEVYHNGRWLTAPEEGLPVEYAGDYIRLIPDDLSTHTAYWTAGDGLNSDEFTYMT